ncbi:MAG: DUF6434 domain-containing protein [Bacteroidota bacterium]
MQRPDFAEIKSGAEFNNWYWLKEEMVNICIEAGLPANGRKFELRDRIMYALDHKGQFKKPVKKKTHSKFNWAKAELSLDTIITDNVSFGPNFRRFMKGHLGKKFSCHSDFMDWVKANEGKTLKDALDAWLDLEARKKDPNFKRTIADNNMYSQYIRDFAEDNPGKTIKEVRKYWLLKKEQPMENGFVRYHPDDLKLK